MNKLIKNELTKIFKKKSIYITLFIILAFVILTNCIYKFSYNSASNYYYNDDYIQTLKEELVGLDPTKESDMQLYINVKTQLDLFELSERYDKDSWQIDILQTKVFDYINQKNNYIYGEVKDENKVKEMENKINDIIERLDKDDWTYFAQQELEEAKSTLEELEKQKDKIQDKQELKTLKDEIEYAKINKQVAEYRIDKDIKYGHDYKNRALNTYQNEAKNVYIIGESKESLTYSEKQEYNESIKNKDISKYIIENDVDVNKSDDLRGILRDLFEQYGLFIIVMIVMVAGTIVSEEFNKGTIKLLLIKPYTRHKLLLSKLITIFIMIAFSIFAVIIMELIVGGIIFGFDSLSVPVLAYNFNTQTLESMSIFTYLGIQVLVQLPKYILLATLAFACSTLFTNSAVAIAIPLLGYMSADIINQLVVQFKVEFMRFFVSMNWNFNEYLFGNLPRMEGMTALFSDIICILYFIAMIVPTFLVFKKKNIKNI